MIYSIKSVNLGTRNCEKNYKIDKTTTLFVNRK